MPHFPRRRGTLLIGAAAMTVALGLAAAFALHTPTGTRAASQTAYVGMSIGDGSSCASPGYTSIQAAVDAATTGGTVYVCAGTYAEQVVLHNKQLTLTGDSGATISPPTTWPAAPALPAQFAADNLITPQAIVFVWGASTNVAISNLTIAGPFNNNSGCLPQTFGVLVIADGSATLSNDHVTDVRDSSIGLFGCQHGIGIQIGRKYWPDQNYNFYEMDFAGHATITNTTVTGYQKNGMTIDGPGSTADVESNTVTGAGPTPLTAQNGIQVSRGANATLHDNTISDNFYTGESNPGKANGNPTPEGYEYYSTGILLYQPGDQTTLSENFFSGNQRNLFHH